MVEIISISINHIKLYVFNYCMGESILLWFFTLVLTFFMYHRTIYVLPSNVYFKYRMIREFKLHSKSCHFLNGRKILYVSVNSTILPNKLRNLSSRPKINQKIFTGKNSYGVVRVRFRSRRFLNSSAPYHQFRFSLFIAFKPGYP